MKFGRRLYRAALLFATIFGALANFAWLWICEGWKMSRIGRAMWLHRWCVIALARLDIERDVRGPLPQSGLVVSNHLSYLDILVFSAAFPCVFVSKSEVRRWPVFGWLASLAGTIYVDRQRRSQAPEARRQMEEALRENIPVVLFPEGTSSDGSAILPFRSALFEPAVKLNLPVTPAHIGYVLEGGSAANDVCYWGEMTLVPHLFKLLSRGKLKGRIRISAQPQTYSNRKDAATLTREEVVTLAAEAARESLAGEEAAASCSRLQIG